MSSRFSGESVLESHNLPRIGHRPRQKTATATTGPAHAPRPASSTHNISINIQIIMIKGSLLQIKVDFFASSDTMYPVMYKEKTFFEYFDAYRKHYGAYEERPLEELREEIMIYAKKMKKEDQALIESAYELGKRAHK